ncbi:MAG: type II secretion system GspH family protein [Candidatus Kerfeldbacteria bacterium]|nr:type II secretion system GspH family protein [Candidatus Kerfeldbacteria bacterium]
MTRNNGFTILELLLYIGVTALMLSTIISFFFLFINGRTHNNAQREVEQQGGVIMQFIQDSIQQASSVTTPTPSNQGDVLEVSMYDVDYGTRTISIEHTDLIVEDLSGVYTLNSDTVEVSGLSFTNVASGTTRDSITVSFTVSTHNISGRSEYAYADTFTSTFTRR